MSPTSYSQAFSSLTRLLALLKNVSEVPKWLKLPIRPSLSDSFSQASTILGKAIRKIPTRAGMIGP